MLGTVGNFQIDYTDTIMLCMHMFPGDANKQTRRNILFRASQHSHSVKVHDGADQREQYLP